MNKEVKPTWNYILNDLALYSLFMRVAYSEDVPKQDKVDLEHQIKLLQQENKQFRQANVEFVSQNNKLQHRIYEAIDYIKHSWWLRTDQTYDTSKDLKDWEVEELLSILERGKE